MACLVENFALVAVIIFVMCDKTVGQNVYNFTCDLSPQQHDKILQEARNKLEKGDLYDSEVLNLVYDFNTPQLVELMTMGPLNLC